MKVIVDQDKCIGCGNCEELCPAVFHVDETIGKALVIDAEACEFAACCEAAEENCPQDAISL
ncbi:MAG: ferredoxin [Candidatus Magnetoovum sp. WYHC-5]|nr:ferredoxin [Candidatus Magnetoovum sp. WYHC-5]